MRKGKQSRAERHDWNRKKFTAPIFCNTVQKLPKSIWQEISRTGPSSTHITNASATRKADKPSGVKSGGEKIRFLSHSIRQRSQICWEWSEASRTEWFQDHCAENWALWQLTALCTIQISPQYWRKGWCFERGKTSIILSEGNRIYVEEKRMVVYTRVCVCVLNRPFKKKQWEASHPEAAALIRLVSQRELCNDHWFITFVFN